MCAIFYRDVGYCDLLQLSGAVLSQPAVFDMHQTGRRLNYHVEEIGKDDQGTMVLCFVSGFCSISYAESQGLTSDAFELYGSTADMIGTMASVSP